MKNNIKPAVRTLYHGATISNLHSILHPLNFVILPIFFIIAIFSANNISQYIIILVLSYLNLLLVTKAVKYRVLIIFILCLIPVLLAVFLSSYLFTNGSSGAKINMAYFLTMRYFLLALISFAYSIHTPFSLLFNYLIQRKILSVKIGYAILAAFNSFHFLAGEFRRIQVSYKMRHGKNCYSPIIFIALLTTAARYAHNLSISMYSRGIDKNKTFVVSASKIRFFDYILLGINLITLIFSFVIF